MPHPRPLVYVDARGEQEPCDFPHLSQRLSAFAQYVSDEGLRDDVVALRRRDVEAFVGDRLRSVKPATVPVRFRSLQQFFKWAVAEEESETSVADDMTLAPDRGSPVIWSGVPAVARQGHPP